MSDVSRAFQLCQNGAEAELASMLQSRTIDAAACQTTGMYSGWSLLHAAASKGHMRIVQMLLAAGAPASACNPQSLTPAQVAHEKGHTAVAALLQQAELSPGAALGAAAAVGKAFNLCLSGKDAELSKMLNEGAIAASACQTRGMYAGWSLLHAAAMKGHEHIVEVLLAFGASGKLTTPKGKTAAQLANDMGHSTLAALLRGTEPAAAGVAVPASFGAASDSEPQSSTLLPPSAPASVLPMAAPPPQGAGQVPSPQWIACGKFGERRCRFGGACPNRLCGFAHPTTWQFLRPQKPPPTAGEPSLTEPAVPEPAVVWIPSGKFGNRRCREGGACHNAQCGFAHPSDWVHFHGEYLGYVTSPWLGWSGPTAEDAWQAEQMAWPMGGPMGPGHGPGMGTAEGAGGGEDGGGELNEEESAWLEHQLEQQMALHEEEELDEEEQKVHEEEGLALHESSATDTFDPQPLIPRRAATVPAPREAMVSSPALAPRRMHSEPARLSRRLLSESSVAHRSSIVCEQVPWRVAEKALRTPSSGVVLHLPSLFHYPRSAPLVSVVLGERITDECIDRVHTLGSLPHMAPLCAVSRHPVEPKSALFFGWPELGTFAHADATGPWFVRHPWQTLLTVLNGVAVGLCALHGAGEAHGAVTPAAVGVRRDGSAWLLPCGSLHVRPSGSATLGEKALARDADLRGVGQLLHELASAGASAVTTVAEVSTGEAGADEALAAEFDRACRTSLSLAYESLMTGEEEAMAEERVMEERRAAHLRELVRIANPCMDSSRIEALDEPSQLEAVVQMFHGQGLLCKDAPPPDAADATEDAGMSTGEGRHIACSGFHSALHIPREVSRALLDLAHKCEALELTMLEVASKLADVLRMSVLSSSVSAGDLPPATQRWSRLRVLITAAAAFTGASVTPAATCLICLSEVSTRCGLACPEGHLICSECLQGYICSLAGSAKLRSSNGSFECLGAHEQPFSFDRSRVEPLLYGDGLRLYLETMETFGSPDGEVFTPESIQPKLHEALNLTCPSCEEICDPDPDGCIAMRCSRCNVAFCWLCFEVCGSDAHPHCREVHGGYFPPRAIVDRWSRRLRWRRVDRLLLRSFGCRMPERQEALRLCERILADNETRLWPFPSMEPSVGGTMAVMPHVHAAQFGLIDELESLLDDMPQLLDQTDDRGMSALMAAAHGGHAAVVTVLLEHGADVGSRDDRGVSALDYAVREDRREVALAILTHAGHDGLEVLFQRRERRGGLIPHEATLLHCYCWAEAARYDDILQLLSAHPRIVELRKWKSIGKPQASDASGSSSGASCTPALTALQPEFQAGAIAFGVPSPAATSDVNPFAVAASAHALAPQLPPGFSLGVAPPAPAPARAWLKGRQKTP